MYDCTDTIALTHFDLLISGANQICPPKPEECPTLYG